MIINEIIFDLIMKRWGTTKLAKVLGYMLIGASVGAIVGATVIKDDPMLLENIEKEKR